MKTSHLLLLCLCAQAAVAQPEATLAPVAPATTASSVSVDKQSEAAELARQADAKLQQAASPQEVQEAAALFEQSVKLDPENYDVRQTLGWVYLDRLHEPYKAYHHLAKVAKNHPDDVNARKLFGMACSQTGRPHQAAKEFRAASQLQPDDLWIRANLARSLAQSGDYGEANTIYAEILKTDPNNPDARLGQAEIEAWHGHQAGPLQTLNQLAVDNPTNADVLILRGDVHRWNWDLTEAEQDYQHVLDLQPNNYVARNGLEEAEGMGASHIGLTGYWFKDEAHFLRESLEADARVHVTDNFYLLGGGAGWRFANPGFDAVHRVDGRAGAEVHLARWLEIAGEGDYYDYDTRTPFVGGKASAKISPFVGTDLYANIAYHQPFVSSMPTVVSGMKENSVGVGLDTKLFWRFSFQAMGEGARLSDGNRWWEAKPQLSFRVFDKPETYVRVQYDYLSYAYDKTTYWTPLNRHTVAPVLDTSIPICKFLHLVGDAKAPYVFSESKFGFQAEGGPEIDLFNHLKAKAVYYYSTLPGDQGAWSGQGGRAELQVRF